MKWIYNLARTPEWSRLPKFDNNKVYNHPSNGIRYQYQVLRTSKICHLLQTQRKPTQNNKYSRWWYALVFHFFNKMACSFHYSVVSTEIYSVPSSKVMKCSITSVHYLKGQF